MKTTDLPIAGLIRWNYELEDRYLAMHGSPLTTQPTRHLQREDGPISRPECLNSSFAGACCSKDEVVQWLSRPVMKVMYNVRRSFQADEQ